MAAVGSMAQKVYNLALPSRTGEDAHASIGLYGAISVLGRRGGAW